MKYSICFILFLLLMGRSQAMANPIQESLYNLMQSHQGGKLLDKEFNQQLQELKNKSEWQDEQSIFLNDYVSSLPLEKQAAIQPVITSKADIGLTPTKNSSDYQTMNLNADLSFDEKPAAKDTGVKNKTWMKWVLGVVGVALLLTPYKVVVHSF